MIAPAINIEHVRRLYDAGATFEEIGAAIGISRNRARYLCRKNGMPPRLRTSICRTCDRVVHAMQVGVCFCSNKCKRIAYQYDRCVCGRVKSRRCSICRKCYETRTPDARIACLYRQGHAMRAIANIVGVSVGAVQKAMRRQGVQSRPRGCVVEVD